MFLFLLPVLNLWNRRWAKPKADALAAVAGLTPATVVTGASRGVGRVLAQRFAESGDTVVLVARDEAELEKTAKYIRLVCQGRAFVCPLDVTAPGAPQLLHAFLAANALYPNVLVNNAGMGLGGRFDGHAPDDIEKLLTLNIVALTRLMRHVLPGMRDRAKGGVLNVASLGGLCPGPYQAAYYASKAYVISLTEAVASEIAGEGVRVSALAPGPLDTRFHAAMGADDALYRWLVPAMAPEAAANAAWRGFMTWRRVIVPGIIPRGLALAVGLLPHQITVPLIGSLLFPRGRIKKATP